MFYKCFHFRVLELCVSQEKECKKAKSISFSTHGMNELFPEVGGWELDTIRRPRTHVNKIK